MPTLFIYAVAFLSVLMVVGFVLCWREDAGSAEGARRRGRDASPPVPGRQPEPPHPAGRRPSASGNQAPAHLRRIHAPADRGGKDGHQSSGQGTGDRAAAVPARIPSRDPLPGQIALLFAEVEALRAERKVFEDEIRRLSRMVDSSAARAPGNPESSTAAVIDLRSRRMGT